MDTSYKELFLILISEPRYLSKAHVESLLSKEKGNLGKNLRNLLNPAFPETTEPIPEKYTKLIHNRLIKNLNINEKSCFSLLKTFLRSEYYGSKKELDEVFENPQALAELSQVLKAFYNSECLYRIKCVKYIVSYYEVGPLKEIYTALVEETTKSTPFFSQCFSLLAKMTTVQEYQNITEYRDALIKAINLLTIMNIDCQNFVMSADEIVDCFRICKMLFFNLKSANTKLVQANQSLLHELGMLISVLFIQLLDFDAASECLREKNETHHLYDEREKLNEIAQIIWKSDFYNVLGLALFSISHVFGQIPPLVERIAERSMEEGVFLQVLEWLQSPLVASNQTISDVIRQVLFKFLRVLFTQFEYSNLCPNIGMLLKILEETVKSKECSIIFHADLKKDSSKVGFANLVLPFVSNLNASMSVILPVLAASCHFKEQSASLYDDFLNLETENLFSESLDSSSFKEANGANNGWLAMRSCLLKFNVLAPQSETFPQKAEQVHGIVYFLKSILHCGLPINSLVMCVIEPLPQTILNLSTVDDPSHIKTISFCFSCLKPLVKTNPQLVLSELILAGVFPDFQNVQSKFEFELSPSTYTSIILPLEAKYADFAISRSVLELLLVAFQTGEDAIKQFWRLSFGLIMHNCLPILIKDVYTSEPSACKAICLCLDLMMGFLHVLRQYSDSFANHLSSVCLNSEASQVWVKLLDLGNAKIISAIEALSKPSRIAEPDCVAVLKKGTQFLVQILTDKPNEKEMTEFETAVFYSMNASIFKKIIQLVFLSADVDLLIPVLKLINRLNKLDVSIFSFLGTWNDNVRDRFCRILSKPNIDPLLKSACIEVLCNGMENQSAFVHHLMNFDSSALTPNEPSVIPLIVATIMPEENGSVSEVAVYDSPEVKQSLSFFSSVWLNSLTWLRQYLSKLPKFWPKYTEILFLKTNLEDIEEPLPYIECLTYVFRTLTLEVHQCGLSNGNESLKKLLSQFLTEGYYLRKMENLDSLVYSMVNQENIGSNYMNVIFEFVTSFRMFTSVLLARPESLKIFKQADKKEMKQVLKLLISSLVTLIESKPREEHYPFINCLTMLLLTICKSFEEAAASQTDYFCELLDNAHQISGPKCGIKFLSSVSACLVILMQQEPAEKIENPVNIDRIISASTQFLEYYHNSSETLSGMNEIKGLVDIAISLLSHLYLRVTSTEVYLCKLNNFGTFQVLHSIFKNGLSAQNSSQLSQAILAYYIQLSLDKRSAAALTQSNVHEATCLALTSYLSERKTQEFSLFHSFMALYANLLRRLEGSFLKESLDVIGSFQERICFKLKHILSDQSEALLEEVLATLHFIFELGSHMKMWRYHCGESFEEITSSMAHACQTCIALLIRPKYLQYLLTYGSHPSRKRTPSPSYFGSSGGGGGGGSSSVHRHRPTNSGSASRHRSVSSTLLTSATFTLEDAHLSGDELIEKQRKLLEIISYILATFNRMSMSVPQACIVSQCVPDDYPLIFHPSFATPSLDNVTTPSFGTLTSCANYALGLLLARTESGKSPRRLVDSPGSTTHLMPRQSIGFVLDSSVMLLITQTALVLRHDGVNQDVKQTLTRDVGGELNTLSTTITRYFSKLGLPLPSSRESSRHRSDVTPAKSPVSTSVPRRPIGSEQTVLQIISMFLTNCLSQS